MTKHLGPEYSLQENYWIHVELFPETASQYSAIALNDLHVTFLCARAGEAGNCLFSHTFRSNRPSLDALTSEIPTFPYTASQCEEFIELLQRSKGVFQLVHLVWPSADWLLVDHASSPYVVAYVANLWATLGRLYASMDCSTPHDPSHCSKPPLLHPFWQRALPNVLGSIHSRGLTRQVEPRLGKLIKYASFRLSWTL